MKLTGPACTEALNGAEEAKRRERAEDNAGGVRVERKVRRGQRTLFLDQQVQVNQARDKSHRCWCDEP